MAAVARMAKETARKRIVMILVQLMESEGYGENCVAGRSGNLEIYLSIDLDKTGHVELNVCFVPE